jgi:amino acid adenylation domain-containing protein
MQKRYSKEDIDSVFKTHFGEQSLIVMELDKNNYSYYVETALIKIQDRKITENELSDWISTIPRFREVFIYEKIEQPLRVRLKKIEPSIQIINSKNWTESEIFNWLESQDIRFNIQQGPLFQFYIFENSDCQFLSCCYHHLLFDAISIQQVFASLLGNFKISEKEWIPKIDSNTHNKVSLPTFHLQNYVPEPKNNDKGFLYEPLEFKGVEYNDFMTKWIEFLFLATGQKNICVGEVFSARGIEPTAQSALGYFVQTWPLVFKKEKNDISNQLDQQRSLIISRCDKPVQNYFHHGAFDHCWVVEPKVNSDIRAVFRSKPHYVLSIVIQPNENGTSICFVWNLSKIAKPAAEEISGSFMKYISGETQKMVSCPTSYKNKPISENWLEKVSLSPEKIAVKDSQGNKYTYKELDDLAENLASKMNVEIQEPVGIRTSNSASLIIAILAVLKKRAIYVPLDPDISKERLNFILNDAGIQTIVSDLEPIENIETIHPLQDINSSDSIVNLTADLNDICYLIYTSGTTGKPKGCSITHANLSNLFKGTSVNFDFLPSDSWVLAHSYGFDFSTWEIWGALLNGSSLYIPDRMEVKDTFKFYDLLLREKITVVNQTPKSFENLMLVGESKEKLSSVRYLIFGGDKLNFQKISSWKEENPSVSMVNMYGITETTVHVTFKEVSFDNYSNIGKPLPGYSLGIFNSNGEFVPDGFLGELIVGGDGVCNGYFKNESLTMEKFSFSSVPTYKSGDIGWKMKGDFFYLGRNDRQIKIRGHRIELGEIEFLLQAKFGSLFRVLFMNDTMLVAFHTCSTDLDRTISKDILPDYANPSIFVRLDEIPLNVNGKTDEKRLEAIFKSEVNEKKDKEKIEILPYLSKILGNDFSTDKSFIENGGDSISAIRLVNALRKEGLNLSVQDLFAAASLKEIKLSRLTIPKENQSWRDNKEIETFNQANDESIIGLFPLTDAQQGILFDSLSGDDSVYMVQLTYHVGPEISTDKLEKAYQAVMASLPALHLQLRRHNEEYVWVLPKNANVEVNKTSKNGTLEDVLNEDFKRSFDFSKNLIRLTILEEKNGDKLLIWTHHHLLMDGWSLGIFSKLLFEAIKGYQIEKKESYLYFLYQLKNQDESNQIYWKNRLKNSSKEAFIPFLTIGSDSTDDYSEIKYEIQGMKLWDNLKSKGFTQNHFVFSAWLAFISVVFEKNNISCGRINSLREGALDDEIGMLIQTLPFPIRTDLDNTFLDFAERVKSQLISDNQHRDIALTQLEDVHLNLDHIFVFENYPIDKSLTQNSIIKIGAFKEKTAAKFTFICYPKEDGIDLRILFQRNFYPPEYVLEILNRFSEFIKAISWESTIDQTLKSLSMQNVLSGIEKRLENDSNLFDHFTKHKSIQLVREQSIINYQQILAEVKNVCKTLREFGLEQNEAVGIDLTSSSLFIQAVLSIWKLGAVPCSVDNKYPEQRKSFIWQNASCRFILTEKNKQLSVERLNHTITKHPENASFILHTSGSTGVPKGVIQTKDCLVHLADWTANELSLDSNERILALSSFGFDASYHELILWLNLGATIVEMPFEKRQDIQEIRDVILNQKISLAWIPARLLNSILDVNPNYFDECESLKQIVTTGEALIVGNGLKSWVERKNIRLFNFYGPTETHVVTAKIVDLTNIYKAPDIGKPITNAKIGLFTPVGNSVPKGTTGEIWISGPYLAYGYLNDPDLTEQKFITKDGVKWYKSGDLGWFGSDGQIEYLGRLDNQIKIRGFRVEPFEVEMLLHNVEGIDQAAVTIFKGEELKLIAFWTGNKLSDREFRKACAKILPDFMIPEIQVNMDSLPRNINGKIDRKLLLQNYLTNIDSVVKSMPVTKASKCWEAVLEHKNFKSNSNFQAVGGNSIKIMRMQAWLDKNYNISVSVSELINHTSISELDLLISEKEKEIKNVLPTDFPLSPVQNDILNAEIGNYALNESPFLLSFSCQLPDTYSEKDIQKAIDHIFIVYPHLGYAISDVNQQKKIWKYLSNFRTFVNKPLNNKSILNSEPLLRIHFENNELFVEWHHILLDAVGISMVMQEFYQSLFLEKPAEVRNYGLFLQHFETKNNAKTESSNKSAEVYKRVLINDDRIGLEQISTTLNASLQDLFLMLAHSIFDSKSTIGYTDNSQQIGIPGMFTFLNQSNIFPSKPPGELLLKDTSSDKTVSMVMNFMYSPELPIEDIELENSTIINCKYPYELQVEVEKQMINLMFICEKENPIGKEKAHLLFENLDKLLIEKSFSRIFNETSKKIEFEDFDF